MTAVVLVVGLTLVSQTGGTEPPQPPTKSASDVDGAQRLQDDSAESNAKNKRPGSSATSSNAASNAGSNADSKAPTTPSAPSTPPSSETPAPPAHTPRPSTIGPSTPKRASEQGSGSSRRPSPDEQEEGRRWVEDINQRVLKAVKTIKSTECGFYKEEWKKKELEPSQATLKHRVRGDVFIDFSEGPNAGRQILFRPGKNDNKLLVSNPLMNLSLDPSGYLATRNNRHSISKAGLLIVAKTIVRDARRVRTLGPGVATYEKLGRRKIAGEQSRCFRSIMNKKKHPELFASKTEICVSERTGLPIEVKVWQHEGGRLRRVGLYRYSKCRVNKLTDKDFDPDNPAYKF